MCIRDRDERGKQCPLPVIEAKRALEAAAPGEAVEVVVDNEIAVQNLKKLADHKGLSFASEKKSSREYVAVITAGEGVKEGESAPQADALPEKEPEVCHPDGRRKGMVVVISSREMGQGCLLYTSIPEYLRVDPSAILLLKGEL